MSMTAATRSDSHMLIRSNSQTTSQDSRHCSRGVLKVDPQVVYLSDPHSGFAIVTAGSCQIVLVSTVRTV